MSVARYRYVHPDARLPSVRIPQHILCDLETELPTVDVGEGDTAYAKDSDKLFKRAASAWVNIVTAANVSNTPAGNISATDAQAAINELDAEKVAKAGDTMSGLLSWGATNPVPAARLRHLDGKEAAANVVDTLYLNYGAAGKGVQIGDSGTDHPLVVYGSTKAHPVAAAFAYDAYSTAAGVYTLQWAVTRFNTTSTIVLQSTNEQVKVTEAAYYDVVANAVATLTAGAAVGLDIYRFNSSGVQQESRGAIFYNTHASASRTMSLAYESAFSAAANDYFVVKLTTLAGTVTPYTAETTGSDLIITRLN